MKNDGISQLPKHIQELNRGQRTPMEEHILDIQRKQFATALDIASMYRTYVDIIAPGANLTKEEFAVYVDYCKKRGFDPLAKDIYAVKRWDSKAKREVLAFQSSIDAMRKRAVAHPDYQGQAGPFWCSSDGVWKDVWLSKEPPQAAKVGIWRTNFKEPLYSVARLESYAQKTKEGRYTSFWQKMSDVMLAKCAESAALRRAFPDTFSGIYSKEEMMQAQASNDEDDGEGETYDQRVHSGDEEPQINNASIEKPKSKVLEDAGAFRVSEFKGMEFIWTSENEYWDRPFLIDRGFKKKGETNSYYAHFVTDLYEEMKSIVSYATEEDPAKMDVTELKPCSDEEFKA